MIWYHIRWSDMIPYDMGRQMISNHYFEIKIMSLPHPRPPDVTRYEMKLYDIICYQKISYDSIWCHMISYDTTWYHIISYQDDLRKMVCQMISNHYFQMKIMSPPPTARSDIWFRVIWYHIISCDIIWYHMISYDIIWYHMISYNNIWHHMISYNIIWYQMTSYNIIWHHTISYEIKSYQTIWYHFHFHVSGFGIQPQIVTKLQTWHIQDNVPPYASNVTER